VSVRLRLATRGSPLALRQTELVGALLARVRPEVEVETVVVSTQGDRMADEPLGRIGGQGVFVKEVQAAVLDGRADAAVHSAKDLPPLAPDGLVIAAVPPRADPRDALVGSTLSALSPGAVVATGSARRRAQMANLRPDLTFVELRGNMARRLDRVGHRGVSAVVVAMAALERLGWSERADEVLTVAQCMPQVGQGTLAVECRDADAVREVLGAIDDPVDHAALDAERALLGALGAGCSLPVGAMARANGDDPLTLDAMMASGDGRVVVRASDGLRVTGDTPATLGERVAAALVERFPEWDG
jgi:hydroxymethylbilane synthase